MELFTPGRVDGKKITAEVCVHHMYFNESRYADLGNQIKCNPSIKFESDRLALIDALLEDKIDIIATDHAPHTWEEKNSKLFKGTCRTSAGSTWYANTFGFLSSRYFVT